MNDAIILYFFGFLLVSNLVFSILYAFGTTGLRSMVRKSEETPSKQA